MELRVETLPGCSLPNGCYIGVRVGEVSKQGRYDPLCCYRFPPLERQRNAKIDLYQHLGTCSAVVDPETRDNEVSISASEPGLNNVRLKVSTRPELVAKPSQDRKTTPFKKQAKEYLGRHHIEERLSAAVKAMLASQPEDPTEFLVAHLRESCPNSKTASVGSSHPRECATDAKQAAATPATTARSNDASAAAPPAAVTPETTACGNAPTAALPAAASEVAAAAAVPPRAPEAGSPGAVSASLHSSATVAGLPALIDSLRDATVGEVATCLSGVAPVDLQKLENCLELHAQEAAALKIQAIGRGNASRRMSAQRKAESLPTLIESLKNAQIEEVAECFSGVPPGELQKLERDEAMGNLAKGAGLDSLVKSIGCAAPDEIVECLFGVPRKELEKLETVVEQNALEAAAVKIQAVGRGNAARRNNAQAAASKPATLLTLTQSLKGASIEDVAECLSGVPREKLQNFEQDVVVDNVVQGAGLDFLIERFKTAEPAGIAECLLGLPRKELERLQKVVELAASEAAAVKIQAVGRGNAARRNSAQA